MIKVLILAPYWVELVTLLGDFAIAFSLQWGQILTWERYSVTRILISGILKTCLTFVFSIFIFSKSVLQWGQVSISKSTTKSGFLILSRVKPLCPTCLRKLYYFSF